jgi:hypothetical protein
MIKEPSWGSAFKGMWRRRLACDLISPGHANLRIGVLDWISKEPSWGSAFPGNVAQASRL